MANSVEHGALDTVLELQQEGKLRFIGISSTLPHLKDHIAMGMFDVFQIPYSALQREHEAVISAAADGGAGLVIHGGEAKGAPSEGKQEGSQWARWRQARLDDLLEEMTRMEFILRFTFSHPEMHTNIVGAINALLKGPLPETIYVEAKRCLELAG
jgi:aryl-alcohol dehydrogenase-like predicted oxidoreductase